MADNNNKFAYSLLTIEKSFDNADGERVIEGIASTPSPDRVGDIVEPLGMSFGESLPLLMHHNHNMPVGEVKFEKPTAKGVRFTAKIARILEPGVLRDRTDEAWQSVKAGLIKGVSIGFKPIEYAPIQGGGIRFTKSEVIELSLVTVPANRDATIQTIKSLAQDQAASGNDDFIASDNKNSAGVSAPLNIEKKAGRVVTLSNKNNKEKITMKFADQIKSFETELASKKRQMAEIMEKSSAEGRTLDATESDQYDEIAVEIESIEKHLTRLRQAEKLAGAEATPVVEKTVEASVYKTAGAGHFEPRVIHTEEKGLSFARFARAVAASKGNLLQAKEIASRGADRRVYEALTKAAEAGTTTSTDYAALVEYQTLEAEFIELLRPATIVGQISGFREIPFNVRIPGQSGATSVGWVGEGERKPSTGAAFNDVELGWKKLAGIVVLSDELIRDSSPSADRLIRDDLVRSIAQEVDAQFILPTRGATSSRPASVTSGVTAVPASGQTAADLRKDVSALFQAMLTANLSYGGSVFVMSEVQAMRIGMLVNDLGQPEFPTMQGNTKTLFGLPVVASEAVGNIMALVKASEIFMSRGAVTVATSNEATIELDGGPVNMFENNLTALRAEQYINWQKRRAAAVQYISGANYDGTPAE
ncbi:phage major capsid protein [Halomonas daqingensis]|uniref:Phage major capsid protein n=1 Tax=Billgrantia desiderata TaxID=52021 RepID=A0AAW4YWM2_9GAMM|nr:phage major capsid protein [Halomonas desiderata]MCE8052285.1 phage major capsid protein [Halomonas desiderata]